MITPIIKAIIQPLILRLKLNKLINIFFDISSSTDTLSNHRMVGVLELTSGSFVAVMKYYDVTDSQYLTTLQTDIKLSFAYTGSSTKVAIMSDTHLGGADNPDTAFTAVIDAIDDTITGCSKVFVLGDIVMDDANYYGSGAGEYKTIRATSDIADTNWHELAGNHDVISGVNGFQAELLGGEAELLYYKIEVGNCVFLLLSDEETNPVKAAISSAANTWAASTLAANTDKNCFIMTHQSQYDLTRYSLFNSNISQGWIDVPAGQDGGWIARFFGHSHGYTTFTEPDSDRIFVGDIPLYDTINGSMKNDPTNYWFGYFAAIVEEATIVPVGYTASLKVTDEGAGAAAQRRYTTVIGEDYKITGKIYALSVNSGSFLPRLGASSRPAGFAVAFWDSINVNAGDGVAADDTWYDYEITFTASETTTWIILGCQNDTNDVTYFAGLAVNKVS